MRVLILALCLLAVAYGAEGETKKQKSAENQGFSVSEKDMAGIMSFLDKVLPKLETPEQKKKLAEMKKEKKEKKKEKTVARRRPKRRERKKRRNSGWFKHGLGNWRSKRAQRKLSLAKIRRLRAKIQRKAEQKKKEASSEKKQVKKKGEKKKKKAFNPFASEKANTKIDLKNKVSSGNKFNGIASPYLVFDGIHNSWDESHCVLISGDKLRKGRGLRGWIGEYPVQFKKEFRIAQQQQYVFDEKYISGRHHVLALRIDFDDDVCGENYDEECAQVHSAKEIHDVLVGGISQGRHPDEKNRSVADFWAQATRGKVKLTAKVEDLVLPEHYSEYYTGGLKEFSTLMHKELKLPIGDGPDEYDHVFFFLPSNWKGSDFGVKEKDTAPVNAVIRSGFQSLRPGFIWASECDIEGLMHEFGHLLGLGHAGGGVKKHRESINMYQDVSSVMSAGIPFRLNQWMNDENQDEAKAKVQKDGKNAVALQRGPYSYRGLSSVELFLLGVIKAPQIYNVVDQTARGIELRSISSNVESGYVAARAELPGGEVFFIEWRENMHQDQDLKRSLCGSMVKGAHTGTVLIKHVLTESDPRVSEYFHDLSTTVDGILDRGNAVVLPLNFDSVLNPLDKSKQTGFVFHFVGIKQDENDNKFAVIDIWRAAEAPTDLLSMAAVRQFVVETEGSIDLTSKLASPSQLLRQLAMGSKREDMPKFLNAGLKALGASAGGKDESNSQKIARLFQQADKVLGKNWKQNFATIDKAHNIGRKLKKDGRRVRETLAATKLFEKTVKRLEKTNLTKSEFLSKVLNEPGTHKVMGEIFAQLGGAMVEAQDEAEAAKQQ